MYSSPFLQLFRLQDSPTTIFNIWPVFSKMIILILMIVGGCTGGTAGGIKIPRLIFFVKKCEAKYK